MIVAVLSAIELEVGRANSNALYSCMPTGSGNESNDNFLAARAASMISVSGVTFVSSHIRTRSSSPAMRASQFR